MCLLLLFHSGLYYKSHHISYMLYIYFLAVVGTALDWTPLDQVMQDGINQRAFPGAVVAVANATNVIMQKSYGHLSYQQDIKSIQTSLNTKYDVASLTKVLATTLAVMNLASSKRISLDDPVSKYIENYDTNKKGNTTIKNLMLHNAGLPYDYPGALPSTQADVIDYIRYIKPIYPVGTNFTYSNLGFLLLGKIVENITNETFDHYTSTNRFFAGLRDTGFNPHADFYRTAPTEYDTEIRKMIVRGEAHERLAYFFGGVAGHSGYFSTAADVINYLRILLNQGKLPEEMSRVLPADIVTTFTKRVEGLPYTNYWAIGFAAGCPSTKMSTCFGHDGSTGISAWCDTDKKVCFVVMSNRGHPDAKNNQYFSTYKEKISTTIMQVLGY